MERVMPLWGSSPRLWTTITPLTISWKIKTKLKPYWICFSSLQVLSKVIRSDCRKPRQLWTAQISCSCGPTLTLNNEVWVTWTTTTAVPQCRSRWIIKSKLVKLLLRQFRSWWIIKTELPLPQCLKNNRYLDISWCLYSVFMLIWWPWDCSSSSWRPILSTTCQNTNFKSKCSHFLDSCSKQA